MKIKNIYSLAVLFFTSAALSAQVGINTPTPQTTLDVVGSGSTTSKDGLMPPRLTKQQLAAKVAGTYGIAQTGSLVYVTDVLAPSGTVPSATQVSQITTTGYHQFDGTEWKAVSSANAVNIYNTDGSLTGNRVVTQAANTLAFRGSAVNAFSVNNAAGTTNILSVDGTNNRVGIGTTAPVSKLDIVGDYFGIKRATGSGSWDNIWIDLTNTSAPAINASGAETGLQFKVGANATGTYGDGQTLATVATLRPNGNFGIGTAAPTGRLHVDGGESRFSTDTSVWALAPTTGGTTGSSNSFEIIDRVNNQRRMVFNDNGDVSLGGNITSNSAAGTISVRTANVGIGVGAPSNTLDVNGTTRVRTMASVTGATVITPVYSDATGVLVKPALSAFGALTSSSVTVSSGATGTLISGMTDGAIYKAIVTSYNGCVDSSIAEFYVTARSGNGFYSINGLGGNIGSGSTSKSPDFTQNSRTSIGVTWTGVVVCQDGANGTGFNYTLAMPSATQINITNNGNVSRTYTIVVTRMN